MNFSPVPVPVHNHRFPFTKFESPRDWPQGSFCMYQGEMAIVEGTERVSAGRGQWRIKVRIMTLGGPQPEPLYPCQLVRP